MTYFWSNHHLAQSNHCPQHQRVRYYIYIYIVENVFLCTMCFSKHLQRGFGRINEGRYSSFESIQKDYRIYM